MHAGQLLGGCRITRCGGTLADTQAGSRRGRAIDGFVDRGHGTRLADVAQLLGAARWDHDDEAVPRRAAERVDVPRALDTPARRVRRPWNACNGSRRAVSLALSDAAIVTHSSRVLTPG